MDHFIAEQERNGERNDMTLLRTMTISMAMALLVVASQAGAQEATHHQPGATPGSNANMMMGSNDPAATCASMMQSMMSDPVIHQRMNELMRRNMQPGNGMNHSMMPTSPASPEPISR
jgi:hypothetical protein